MAEQLTRLRSLPPKNFKKKGGHFEITPLVGGTKKSTTCFSSLMGSVTPVLAFVTVRATCTQSRFDGGQPRPRFQTSAVSACLKCVTFLHLLLHAACVVFQRRTRRGQRGMPLGTKISDDRAHQAHSPRVLRSSGAPCLNFNDEICLSGNLLHTLTQRVVKPEKSSILAAR